MKMHLKRLQQEQPAEPSGRLRQGYSHRGFTLIELLIVIAIIAILASILFPVFARVRENARRASCQSNLKQIGLAVMQYTQDFDEIMPLADLDGAAPRWTDNLQPYLKSYQVFKCPSDDTANPAPNSTSSSYSANLMGRQNSGNLTHPWSTWTWTGTMTLVPRLMAEIRMPTTTILAAEGTDYAWSCNNLNSAACSFTINQTTEPRQFGEWRERHLGTINTLWADGHVKAVKLELVATKATVGPYAGWAGTYTYLTIAPDPD
jgi:prepilin-type N-terminal cleavage/methylation domain-containing protein/prepilin-type processing-associated H-X9-DG protein